MRIPSALAAAYLAALLPATPALADLEAARAVAAERLPGLVVRDAPEAPAETGFVSDAGRGAPGDLSDYAGRVAVVNFWATWCGPCRAEMPSLQRLAEARDDVAVVTVAFGRHNPAAMVRFWDEAGIETLPLHLDADGALARGFGVLGLPHTVILDAEGHVVASYSGEAEWDGEAVAAVLDALTDGS